MLKIFSIHYEMFLGLRKIYQMNYMFTHLIPFLYPLYTLVVQNRYTKGIEKVQKGYRIGTQKVQKRYRKGTEKVQLVYGWYIEDELKSFVGYLRDWIFDYDKIVQNLTS